MTFIWQAPVSKLRLHPRAEDIPTMDPDQYDALVEDIKLRGIQVPLDVLPMIDARRPHRRADRPSETAEIIVLDGRHRLRAAIALAWGKALAPRTAPGRPQRRAGGVLRPTPS